MVEKSLSEEIMRLKRCLTEDPHSRVFVPLAEAYLQANMDDEALSVLSEGLKYDPDLPSARVLLGKVYLRKSAFPEARFQFEQVVAIQPEDIASLKVLADLYKRSKEKGLARAAYRKMLALDPSNTAAEEALEDLEMSPGFEGEAKAPVVSSRVLSPGAASEKAAASLGPSSTNSGSGPQDGYGMRRRAGETEMTGGEGAQRAERRAGAIATPTLAQLYIGQGLYREAVSIYKTLLEKDPSDRACRQGLEAALARMDGARGPGEKKDGGLNKAAKTGRLRSWLDAIQRGKRQ